MTDIDVTRARVELAERERDAAIDTIVRIQATTPQGRDRAPVDEQAWQDAVDTAAKWSQIHLSYRAQLTGENNAASLARHNV